METIKSVTQTVLRGWNRSVCLILVIYYIVLENVYMRNCFIHELELEKDRGTVETSILFFIACFYNKMFN